MFRIGEFSTLARVSDVLLRHYDDIDLLKPRYVDPSNDYRYYSMEQLPQLNRILALRDLGLSLDQIRRLVSEDISPQEIQGMLKLKQAQIEQDIQAERSRLRRVASRLKQVQQEGAFPRHEVVVKEIPSLHFLSIREPVPYIRESGWLYYQVSEAVIESKVPGVSYCMAIFHDPYFRERNVDFELGFLIDKAKDISIELPQGRAMTVKQLDPIKQALTCVHTGPWSELHLGFAAIGVWMEANRTRIAGRPREVYLYLVPPEEDEKLVVEIQMPISFPSD
jgi:DNA-binding transcriptional MerR regulator